MLNGILLMDKPEGMSSAQLTARVKKISGASKAGHAGTLDPFASGLIICCLNRATKLSTFFLHGEKSYEAVLRLGIETDTQDRTGEIRARSAPGSFSAQELERVFRSFSGTIRQIPPVYSALKHKGVPLYKLARKGKAPEKPPREVHISEIRILETSLPDIRFRVSCSGGTYIRTLAADIGRKLGCGAHLTALRRTASSHFRISDALTLPELEKDSLPAHLVSPDAALPHLPSYTADEKLQKKICHGQAISLRDIPRQNEGGLLKLVDRERTLLALVHRKKEEEMYNYSCVFCADRGI